ncbi:FtsK/SpoIIIE domain-containing protein [Xylanimonas ulmi]|uniref:S-DNA-T family DNA segregation ATPase FtsK/SpoIIIE n=1 Tax=Xylanimonas ulmi TaxID=228973 RepID=A0A4Q7LXU3_9MICO|nr:FtsK/SpoIIIE domain-containing protein [Xylanibacterium ulmi]RZS59905.1 S-DNA-T family DNA segregation ATPase FtsK/SpoIIIE [Xylanibacterium ulmi]
MTSTNAACPDVRVTVHPGEDVLLPAGRTLAALREPLADLLRRPELRHATVWADGVRLGPGDVAGERPLLAGATLRVEAGASRPRGAADQDALRSPWMVSRLTGPDAGELHALAPGRAVDLAPGVRVWVSARGRVRARCPRRRGVAIVRTAGRERRRRLGRTARTWRPGDVLDADARYELRRSGDAATLLGRPPTGAAAPDAASPGIGLTLAMALLPVLGSVGLAIALRHPAFMLFSLVGLLAALPQITTALRRRRAARTGGTPGPPPSDPLFGAGASAPPGPAVDPARVAQAALAGLAATASAWQAALRAPHGPLADPVPDGALAIRGTLPHARAAARAVAAELAARGSPVAVTGAGRPEWAWCRWLGVSEPSRATPRALIVDCPTQADLDAAHAAHRAGDAVVLCLPPGADTPSWCRATIDVEPGSDDVARVRRSAPDGGAAVEPLVGVSAAWAERFARRLAAIRSLGRDLAALWAVGPRGASGAEESPLPAGADPADPRLPAVVPLADLLPDAPADPLPDGPAGALADGLAGARAPGRPGPVGTWAAPLGVDAAGRVVTFDLVADGPHLLVAGTTGAGKSELLQAFVLALALRRTPRDLALALIDFKGGASFGACAHLPHVVGQVTDLDAALAARALEGLRAELRRRKEVLAEHAVADADALAPGVLPRLVVVVDEFRALADDLPDLLPGLLRVAAQGRSLGVHLVLATQRPAGAVSADVRANVSARLALRVVDVADSHDVLDSPAAALIPSGTPGRAVLRVGASAPIALQCAYAGAVPGQAHSPARRAPAWSDMPGGVWANPAARPLSDHGTGPASNALGDPTTRPLSDPAPDPVADLVARARAAAGDAPPRWPAPWLPPLPPTVEEAEIGAVPPGSLPLALGDSPSTQSRTAVAWDPASGHLAVLGRARTGRTTALRTLAHAALARGWHVHALAPSSAATVLEPLAAHPGFGTLAGPDDPRRALRLLRIVSGRRDREQAPTLVLVDGVEELRGALATPTHDPLATALAAGGAVFAVTADTASLGGLATRFGPRLVLLSADAAGDAILGSPTALAGRGRTPGRGVWLGADPVECQVARPGDMTDAITAAGVAARRTGPVATPARVLPLPHAVSLADLDRDAHPGDESGAPLVGVGGDGATPVRLDVTAGALVTGPRGAGRTSVLRALARGLARGSRRVVVVGRDRALCADAARLGAALVAPTPGALRTALDALAVGDPAVGDPATPLLLLDDADTVAQTCPLEVDRLAELAADGALAVVASATTLSASMAHRGLLAHLRATRTGLVLAPAERGSEEVFATALDDAAEPGAPHPGRGALVVDGVVVPVQVASPDLDAAGPTDHAATGPRAADAASAARRRLDHTRQEQQHPDAHGERDQHHAERHGSRRPGAHRAHTDDHLEDLPGHGHGPA